MHSMFWPISDILLCGLQMLAGFMIGAIMAINGTDQRRHLPGLRRLGRVAHLAHAQPGPPDRRRCPPGLVSYDRVMEIIRQEREPLDQRRLPAAGRCAGRDRVSITSASSTMPGSPVLQSLHCQPGQVVALVRLHRLGQDQPGQPAAPLLRVHRRPHHPGWRRAEALYAQIPAQPDRHRGAGTVPVLAHRSARTSPTAWSAT